MEGKAYVEPPPVSQWPLHLKAVTLLDVDAVFAMETQREETKRFLTRAFAFMTPEPFSGLRTSRTIKTTKLSSADLERAIALGKFERCPRPVATDGVLHKGVHGVNIFAVPEMKGRRRCIGEPHLNTLVPKSVLPVLHHPSRLDTRQALKDARYCLQIDFVAYYDAIPLQQCMRDHFVFRQGRDYFRLCTLPTGARWSVAVGQAVTWTITDVPTRTTIVTCIDNIMIAAAEHLKTDFLTTVRAILRRIKSANLLTTPDREELLNLNDADLLGLAEKDSCFLGEEYHWDGSQRVVKNSIKTIAKLKLGLAKPWYTRRTFVSLVSLIMYALHTTRINPSEAFYALRAYRGVYSDVSKGADWDETLPHLTESAVNALLTAGKMLLERGWDPIVGPIKATTNEQDYDVVCFTDASGAGWGAVAVEEDGITRTYQQRWIHEVDFSNQAPRKSPAERFTARYSAHTEPHGIAVYLQKLLDRGFHGPATIAIVTDHSPIVFAQRKHNGFGGIGRGFELESLYRLTNTMLHEHNIAVVFFYIKGEFNPADSFSRHFGEDAEDGALVVKEGSCLMPELEGNTFSPMCEVAPGRGYCGDVVHSSVRK